METQAGEAVETVAEIVDAAPEIVKSNPVAVISAAVGGVLIGASLTYLIVNKRLKTKYERIADEEIREAKVFYKKLHKDDAEDVIAYAQKDDEQTNELINSQTEMLKEAAEVVEQQSYVSYDKTSPSSQGDSERIEVTESIRHNIFEDEGKRAPEKTRPIEDALTDNFDLDEELDKKAKGQPYILEVEEFMENESGYSQTTLSYFEGDDVLCDEMDRPINQYMEIIGPDNLQFGHGSRDKNIVYIRNDKLEAEYEITRSPGKYAIEVAGFIEHSEKPRIRKFRDTD